MTYKPRSPDGLPVHDTAALQPGTDSIASGWKEDGQAESERNPDKACISQLQSFESCHLVGTDDEHTPKVVPRLEDSVRQVLPGRGNHLPKVGNPQPRVFLPWNAPDPALPVRRSVQQRGSSEELLMHPRHILEEVRRPGEEGRSDDNTGNVWDTREESTERADHQSDTTEKSFATACSNIAEDRASSGEPCCHGQRYGVTMPIAAQITGELERISDSGIPASSNEVNGNRHQAAAGTSETAAPEHARTNSKEATENVKDAFCSPLENAASAEHYLRPCTSRDVPQGTATSTERRTKLPCAKPSSCNLSILKVLKQVNSSDMRNFSLPINVNEPLSMLQRICEDFEYTNLLSIARTKTTSTERLAYVTIFALSAYAGSMDRCYKPFNPMLGETFECSHRGFNYIAEQVSHHPPVSAYHGAAHNGDFVCFGTVSPVLSIQGTHVDSCNTGTVTLRLFLPGGGVEDYTWHRPNTRVHNIVFGTMWMEWVGNMTVTNHMTGEVAHVTFLPAASSPSSKAAGGSWLPSFRWNTSSANQDLTEPASSPISQSRRRRSNSVASGEAASAPPTGGARGGGEDGQEKVVLGSGRKNSASSRSASAAPPTQAKRGRMYRRSDSWLSKECAGSNGLRGEVLDRSGCPRFFIDGCWSKRLWMTRVGNGSYQEFKQHSEQIKSSSRMNRDQTSGASPSFSRGGRHTSPSKQTRPTSRRSSRHGMSLLPLPNPGLEIDSPGESLDIPAAEASSFVPADNGLPEVCSEQSGRLDQASGRLLARGDELESMWNDDDTFFVAWEATPKPQSAKVFYNMPAFAIELNELTAGYRFNPPVMKRAGWAGTAPTDSRFRPDLRKYEEGDSAGAQEEKLRLEEKQRATARSMKGGESAWRPLWFDKGINAVTGHVDWLYNGRYWPERTRPLLTAGNAIKPTGGDCSNTDLEQSRFAMCPDIY
ncbi:putative oxysterol-binding protein domain-containing protein [Neospora caninum Liverpool]|uniref:Oxysterol-binding protein domain-containing protein, putative n=1 Tax=Neospora caninum (strain Liverpool) TaxID=572307 RepID=F0V7F3_NEOCL|nr:putative oxysterol-binding protein domain-containing protein [Neospora caninum Liverpool]CBZ49644.1 putative oxysterol-binding protein domain-containing protein [Neospora caninum Liverpool]CEL64228.1 TPA: oxysterol-binding protein domain-containing protein, putative [Neospora caninum Liverpool]|eukprot:XP_003879679.1 putative oxysterol-binding protein domain-containing protein [Neospora caninum Liverpool]